MIKKVAKFYQKPTIHKVNLVVEEAVLKPCKNQAVSGPDTSPCQDGRKKNIGFGACRGHGS